MPRRSLSVIFREWLTPFRQQVKKSALVTVSHLERIRILVGGHGTLEVGPRQ